MMSRSDEYHAVIQALHDAWEARTDLETKIELDTWKAALITTATMIGQRLCRLSQEYDINKFMDDCQFEE